MRKEKLQELKGYIDELKTIKLLKTEEKPEFLKSVVYECILNNGETIKREKLIKGSNDGSAVIILGTTNDNELILTVEPRVFTKRTVGIGLPAGYIEDNEMPIDAAVRELKEETGCVGNDIISLGGFYQDMGISSAYNRMFLIRNCIETHELNPDPGEFVKYFKCTLDEALELVNMGYIEGCNALITLDRAKKYIKRRN